MTLINDVDKGICWPASGRCAEVQAGAPFLGVVHCNEATRAACHRPRQREAILARLLQIHG
jgi:hypothetical protein